MKKFLISVSALLAVSSLVNAMNYSEKNHLPLCKTIRANNISDIKKLMETTDCTEKENDGKSPLHVVCECRSKIKIAKWLMNESEPQCDVNAQDNAGNTPLHILSDKVLAHASAQLFRENKNADVRAAKIARFLISHRALINKENNAKETPVILAAKNGNLRLLSVYVEYGASPDEIFRLLSSDTKRQLFTLLGSLHE